LDWIGSVLFAVALVAVMIGLAEGSDWGWRSPPVIALLVCGVALLAGWSGQQLRAGNSAPLVELRLLRHPAVLAADTCAFLLIMAMYLDLSVVTEFVQTPGTEGFGFSASVGVAGLVLIPPRGTAARRVAHAAGARAMGRRTHRPGRRMPCSRSRLRFLRPLSRRALGGLRDDGHSRPCYR
jgi:predicted MFS family arabinose efflux permease